MVHEAVLLGLLALVSPLLVSSAVLPSVPAPPTVANVNNCSGTAAPTPITYEPYFSSYGPQVTGSSGWEEWTFVLPDQLNQSMFHFRWTRGDPAADKSDPSVATFSAFYQKTGFTAELKGTFETEVTGTSLLNMSIGNNVLLFDGSVGLFGIWNASIDIEGLLVTASVDP
jgi:hypothetical protein